jgi:hypothetical protein
VREVPVCAVGMDGHGVGAGAVIPDRAPAHAAGGVIGVAALAIFGRSDLVAALPLLQRFVPEIAADDGRVVVALVTRAGPAARTMA